MKVRFSARAGREVARINDWWIANRPDAPSLLVDELTVASDLIASNPALGAPYDSPHGVVRRVLMPRTRYHAYYVVSADAVVIVSVWGTQRGQGPKV